MTWGAVIVSLGGALVGGLMGSKEKTTGKTNPTSQTTTSSGGSSTQHSIDPRMEKAIYGNIMPNADAWYLKNQSGLNDKMITGMNNQWNQLGSSAQGFNQMQNLGMGLMGGGSAGNPFTGGGGMNGTGGYIAPQSTAYQPAAMSTTPAFTLPEPAAPAPAYSGGGGGGGGGGAAPSAYPEAKIAPVDMSGYTGARGGQALRSGYTAQMDDPVGGYPVPTWGGAPTWSLDYRTGPDNEGYTAPAWRDPGTAAPAWSDPDGEWSPHSGSYSSGGRSEG